MCASESARAVSTAKSSHGRVSSAASRIPVTSTTARLMTRLGKREGLSDGDGDRLSAGDGDGDGDGDGSAGTGRGMGIGLLSGGVAAADGATGVTTGNAVSVSVSVSVI